MMTRRKNRLHDDDNADDDLKRKCRFTPDRHLDTSAGANHCFWTEPHTAEKYTGEKHTGEKHAGEKHTGEKHCRKARDLLCTAFKSSAQTHLCVHLNSCAHSILQIILVPVVQFRAVVLCWDILLWRGLTETSQAAGGSAQQGEAAKSGVNVLTRV